jgi:Zn-dependent protease with chaperone function/uncharacterized tellurite resistance protein B-like protein
LQPLQLRELVFCGDRLHIETLEESYHLRERYRKGALGTHFRERKLAWRQTRLNEFQPLTQTIFKHGNRLLDEVLDALDRQVIDVDPRRFDPTLYHLYCDPANHRINGFCMAVPDPAGGFDEFYICLSAEALRHLSPGQIKYMIGHEIGHALADHGIYLDLFTPGRGETVVPLPVPCRYILRRWRQTAEFTADRFGALALGLEPEETRTIALQTICVATTGLSCEQFDLSSDSLRREFEDLRNQAHRHAPERSRHPPLPARLYAMDAWLREPGVDEKLWNEIKPTAFRVPPERGTKEAAMMLLAYEGLRCIEADGLFLAEEFTRLMEQLYDLYTDFPEEIVMDLEVEMDAIRESGLLATLCHDSQESERVLQCLCEISCADQQHDEKEFEQVIRNFAGKLEVSESRTEDLMQQALERPLEWFIDPLLFEIAEKRRAARSYES